MIANPVPPPPSPLENRFVKRPVQVKKDDVGVAKVDLHGLLTGRITNAKPK